MKITDRFIGDHKTFRKMIADIQDLTGTALASPDRAKLARLSLLFKDHLVIHAWFEDAFFYPAVRSEIQGRPRPPVTLGYLDELEKEHKTIDGDMDRLERDINALSATWPQTFSAFRKGLESHMRKEEEELFPTSEQLLGADGLENLSTEMEKHRSKAPRPSLRPTPI